VSRPSSVFQCWGYGVFGVTGCWGAGVLGCWGAGVLGCWGAGVGTGYVFGPRVSRLPNRRAASQTLFLRILLTKAQAVLRSQLTQSDADTAVLWCRCWKQFDNRGLHKVRRLDVKLAYVELRLSYRETVDTRNLVLEEEYWLAPLSIYQTPASAGPLLWRSPCFSQVVHKIQKSSCQETTPSALTAV
jgi:hypothetical protein